MNREAPRSDGDTNAPSWPDQQALSHAPGRGGGSVPAAAAEHANEIAVLHDLLEKRWTCRAYRPDPVAPELIRNIIDLARRTASWCNTQPWQVVITCGEETDRFRQALTEQARASNANTSDLPFPQAYNDIYRERRRDCGYRLYAALEIARGDRVRYAEQSFENFRLFGAPHVAIITTRADLGPYGAVDCGAFIGAFLLAAQAHGVSSAPQAALAQHAKFIRSYFGLGEDRAMVCGIAFGYADAEHPVNRFRTSRAAIDEVLQLVGDRAPDHSGQKGADCQ